MSAKSDKENKEIPTVRTDEHLKLSTFSSASIVAISIVFVAFTLFGG